MQQRSLSDKIAGSLLLCLHLSASRNHLNAYSFADCRAELAEVEQETTAGLNLIDPLLSRFPDNRSLNGLFAILNTVLFSVKIYRRRIQDTVEDIAPDSTTEVEIQEAGEDLATLVGIVLEVKMKVTQIVNDLKDFRL